MQNPDTGPATRDTPPDGPFGVYQIALAPVRQLDLLFMVDNSPSMAPKVEKMNVQLPKLLAALKDPNDGTYPDLRVAMIDSDLGTGGEYVGGSCGPNDSNGNSMYGDLGSFQMRGASGCGVNSGALWLEYTKGWPVNYDASKDISQVFGCLATNLGTTGCGEEHSLQAFEFALVAKSSDIPMRNPAQDYFLRPNATLGLVFISDEDDCSAAPAPNTGMFGSVNHPELAGESASLRCATRAHMCNGVNLTQSPPGYPTTAPFATNFFSCVARTDSCPNTTDGDNDGTDTTGPTTCSPLKDIHHMATEIKALKNNPDQILVAGIFGWPRRGSDPSSPSPQYKIDLVPNPNAQDTVHPQIYDYWPVCYDPNHLPASAGYDANAWGSGAQGGLRLSAFVDEFGANGLKSSICESDFSSAMSDIGAALARKMENVCVPADQVQGKTCTTHFLDPAVDASGTVFYVKETNSIPQCAGDTSAPPPVDCYALVADPTLCPGAEYRVQLSRPADEIAAGPLTQGTALELHCE